MEKVKRIEKSEKNVVKEQRKPKKWQMKRTMNLIITKKERIKNGCEVQSEKKGNIFKWTRICLWKERRNNFLGWKNKWNTKQIYLNGKELRICRVNKWLKTL